MADQWKNKEELIEYLTNQLIPDLKEAGREYTAEDFESCVHFLKADEAPILSVNREFIRGAAEVLKGVDGRISLDSETAHGIASALFDLLRIAKAK